MYKHFIVVTSAHVFTHSKKLPNNMTVGCGSYTINELVAHTFTVNSKQFS